MCEAEQLEILRTAVETGGRLCNVVDYGFEDAPHCIEHTVLHFEFCTVSLSAVRDDDTLVLATNLPSSADCVCRAAEFWAPGHESKLLWGWMMTNHLGYRDGVRLEFGNTYGMPTLVVNVVVVASTLR